MRCFLVVEATTRHVPLPAEYKQRVIQQFDSRAGRCDAGNVYHPPLAARLLRMAALRGGETLLDVGAGTGFVALPAAEAVGLNGHVTAVDLPAAMLQQAVLKAEAVGLLGRLTFLAADIDECFFDPGSFNAVLCSSALPFLPDIPSALARWRSWLRPGGRVCFNVPKGVGSQAFSVFAALAAQRGLLLKEPSEQFADEAHVQQLLHATGYTWHLLETSIETNLRPGQSPAQWAAAGWQAGMSMPFADLRPELEETQLCEMQKEYLCEATALAEGFAMPDGHGIAEPYEMLWVTCGVA